MSTAEDDRLTTGGTRGWRTTVTPDGDIRQLFLRRAEVTGAEEGIFTCLITDDINPMRSLHVLYPSEL